MTTHPFPPEAIKEFLTPILPGHEQYIVDQLAQSRTIYDILFTEQEEVLPPETPSVAKAIIVAAGLFLLSPTLEQSFNLEQGELKVLTAPDRAVTNGDNIVSEWQKITIPVFSPTADLTIKLKLLIHNANHNRVLLLEQVLEIPAGEYLGGEIDLVDADVVTSIGTGLTFVPSTGEVNASSNGTYSVTLAASVE